MIRPRPGNIYRRREFSVPSERCTNKRTLPKKPITPYIRHRERPAKAMTIAAGLKFCDGILLCADTEQTQGSMKFAGPKIIVVSKPDLAVVFVLAGSVAYPLRPMRRAPNGLSTDSRWLLHSPHRPRWNERESTIEAHVWRLVPTW